jgi:hypothetical protein
MTLLLPFYIKQTLQTKEPIRASSALPIIHELKKITKEWIDSLNKTSELPDLSFLSSPDFLNLTPEQQSAIQHHITIANELKQEKYLPEDCQRLLEISLKLTLLGIQKPSQQLDDKISNLYKRLQQTETYQIIEYGNSNDLSNNPTYLLKDKATDVSFAMLKIPRKPFDSSFSRDIPGITSLLAPVWQNELMSGEQDHLFGFNSIPTSVAVTLKNGEVVKQGIIQEYLPNMTDINQIPWEKKGAQILNSLSTNKVHLLALESLFLGFAAGHGANYVVERMPSDLNKITIAKII